MTKVVYTDGSYTPHPEKAGWSAVILGADVDGDQDDCAAQYGELCGPVVVDAKREGYIGAEEYTNNSAELSALIEALEILTDVDGPFDTAQPLLLRPDSDYAARVMCGVTKLSNMTANKELGRRAQSLWNLACTQRAEAGAEVWCCRVAAHIGHRWNEAADHGSLELSLGA